MYRKSAIAIAASLALAPAAASAADWWWVAGEPGSHDAYFIDADTIATAGAATWFKLLHINQMRGPSPARLEQVHCARTSEPEGDSPDAAIAIHRFACATPAERLSIGAMLGSIAPEATADMIFHAPQPAVAQR